ncbi:glycosyltransferase family 2 protein [Ruminococcus sp. OA3]|nr:glycosyltransferase family 2 protein [Ruminococcus sp. OA3]MCH1982203.1 glycosyltransferase family 2 protein [Ruminococcus sp. OA3]
MREVSVVIPNFNGISFIETCLLSLRQQTHPEFEIIVVDNGSTDGSRELVAEKFPEVRIVALPENLGFCRAVNEGILASDSPYVILLNNDTETEPDFVKELLNDIKHRKKAFSCAAKMLNMYQPELIDDAGNYYNALGWAFAAGKGQNEKKYDTPRRIFASCGGAVIYRRELLDVTGLFDEEHFAYLEDMDIAYRANILGYQNWFCPKARVYHAGSGTSGSRYNLFKVRYSSRNNIYLIYKNMPFLQILLNLPFLAAGFGIKLLFFARKGFGREYAAGIKNGFSLAAAGRKQGTKVRFTWVHLGNYIWIQFQLWINILRRLLHKG